MLDFHEQIVGEVIQNDGIVVMAAGLGLPQVLASVLRLHSAEYGLILVLASNDSQREYVREEMQALDAHACPLVEINNEYTSAERLSLYNQGGTFVITSRILIVDMLNERVPLQRVAGIIVCNCHKVSETCAEAFILRLYRQVNKTGYIRGFTDKPLQMVAGFGKTERVMKSLFVRKLHLWPRFQLSVSTALECHPPEVIDIRMPLTPVMEGIQSAILEVMDGCLKELKKTNRVDIEELTVENGLFKSFDEIVRRQLDPIWHTVGRKTKQLVNDLRTLRKVAEYLQRYDAITFLKYLDNLRMSEGARSVWLFAAPTHQIFELAKRRVYKILRADSKVEVKSKIVKGRTQTQTRKPTRASSQRKNAPDSAPIGFGILNGVSHFSGGERIKMEFPEAGSSSSVLDKREDTDMIDMFEDAENGNRGDEESNVTAEAQGIELEVVAEEMPKWRILREVLEEIEEERKQVRESATEGTMSQDAWSEGGGGVLVACKDERTCLQLNDCIIKGPQKLMREEWNKYLLSKVELQRIRQRSKKKPIYNKSTASMGVGVYNGMVQSRVDIIREAFSAAQQQEQDALLAAAALVEKEIIVPNEQIIGNAPGGRGRGRGKGKRSASEADSGRGKKKKVRGRGRLQSENKDGTNVENCQSSKLVFKTSGEALGADKISAGLLDSKGDEVFANITEESSEGQAEEGPGKPVPPVHYYALESNQRVLDLVKPHYVVIYDPDMSFVRELEVYKAEHSQRPLKVYFLIYEDSTEGQKFEASIRRENHAFETLIRQKASLLIPVDQDGRLLDIRDPNRTATGVSLTPSTRKAGGRRIEQKQQMQVIVDMREFGSSLPCVLHQQGMRIIPVTLEVGDYILSPDICVERKSIADLYSSFASGRLYHQAETMTRYYRLPVLLIEFAQDKSFSLQSASDVGEDIIQANIVSKLSLLVLHFPRLRIVWSRSLHATADIFASLKANQDEPDLERAMRVGVPTEDGLIEGDMRAENFNTTAVELLRRLPGVSDANYRSIMDCCKSLADLALMPVEKLADAMGGQRPARMLRDFLDAKCPVL